MKKEQILDSGSLDIVNPYNYRMQWDEPINPLRNYWQYIINKKQGKKPESALPEGVASVVAQDMSSSGIDLYDEDTGFFGKYFSDANREKTVQNAVQASELNLTHMMISNLIENGDTVLKPGMTRGLVLKLWAISVFFDEKCVPKVNQSDKSLICKEEESLPENVENWTLNQVVFHEKVLKKFIMHEDHESSLSDVNPEAYYDSTEKWLASRNRRLNKISGSSRFTTSKEEWYELAEANALISMDANIRFAENSLLQGDLNPSMFLFASIAQNTLLETDARPSVINPISMARSFLFNL